MIAGTGDTHQVALVLEMHMIKVKMPGSFDNVLRKYDKKEQIKVALAVIIGLHKDIVI